VKAGAERRRADPSGPEAAEAAGSSDWLSQGERGTLLAIHIAFRMATLVGRRPMRPLVSTIALWYRLFDRRAVAASRAWLQRVHGVPPGFWEVYRHLRAFTQVTLDRVFLLTGRLDGLVITTTGSEHLERQIGTGRGAVLLGAHLGSYEVMRHRGDAEGSRIQILGYFENARMINALLERLNPRRSERVIHLGHDPIGVMARVRARLEDGELIAVLGDRVGLNDRVVRARFLGGEAPFAAGPFVMAALLACPVYLVFGLYREPNRYDIHCEPFAERIELPRRGREQALELWAQRFADRLEAYSRRAPDNWFNFFDFWPPSRPPTHESVNLPAG
jgi:predicted LPLAT superfamily acyltransferase